MSLLFLGNSLMSYALTLVICCFFLFFFSSEVMFFLSEINDRIFVYFFFYYLFIIIFYLFIYLLSFFFCVGVIHRFFFYFQISILIRPFSVHRYAKNIFLLSTIHSDLSHGYKWVVFLRNFEIIELLFSFPLSTCVCYLPVHLKPNI